MIACITGDSYLMESAESMARTVLSLPARIPQYTGMARVALALLAVARENAVAASEHYSALRPMAGVMLLYASIDRVLGLLAHTMGQPDQAINHFENALDFCRKAGQRPELAWSLFDYSDTLQGRKRPGDLSKARELLNEAHAIATDLRMTPLMERVAGRIEGLDPQPTSRPVYPGGLSQREVQVLRLVALGRSNREIAQCLGIADGTARRHISNIFIKIGAANRTEAARYALKEGLISLDDAQTHPHSGVC